MKNFTLISIFLGMIFLSSGINAFAQYKSASTNPKFILPLPLDKCAPKSELVIGASTLPSIPTNKQLMDDPTLMSTRYDLQTNLSDQNRIYLYPDGTIGATATMAHTDTYNDRGTGYNYFDGSTWGPLPDARIESEKVGWPSYAPFGPTGEIIVTHTNSSGLMIAKRTTKGTGTWTLSFLPGPAGAVDISWPRMVTNGPNHNYIHILAVTYSTYQGMTNQLLYYRSLDGGATWDFNNYIIPGTTSAQYTNIGGDTYSWANPMGDTIAFTVGDSWMDQFIMKSTDNGTTWTKTIIYHSPYNLGGTATHYFYCPDGTNAIAFDSKGIAHVAFGLTQDSGSYTAGYYNMLCHGLAYWNENMGALDPSLNPDTLFKHHQLGAWLKDTSVLHIPTTELSIWGTSLTSNPQLVIDQNDKIFLIYSGATSLLDAYNFNMRHIYGRDGFISGDSVQWHNDTLVDITSDFIQYYFSESMFPSASPTSDSYVYILFQKDDFGGSYVKSLGYTGTWQGQSSPDDNAITLIKWQKPLWVGVNEKHPKPTFLVEQNYPNPVNGISKINVYLKNEGDLSLSITNMTGQQLQNQEMTNAHPGVNQFMIDGTQLAPGVYFYTVKSGNSSITKKMVVE
jgi:hypothetical protein